MTQVEFTYSDGRISGFHCEGHSGYAEAGSDIICAAVSALVSMTEATVNDVLGAGASVRVREQDAAVDFRLPASLPEDIEESVQAVLTGLMLSLSELHSDYPDYIEVMEVQ